MAYSDTEKFEALVRLAYNKYNWQLTSEQTHIPVRTLRRWDKSVPKNMGVLPLLERAIKRLLMNPPHTMTGHDWAIALGILLDKFALFQGQPTSRHESIFSVLEQIPDKELDDLYKQFESAAARASASADRD